jgi:nicotinic acid mononucleotide adenylyltransferase
MSAYENIAWVGGSFSPPTIMHVNVVIEVGIELLKLTKAGNKCCVCIVPVSGRYKKGSVRDECISQDRRWKLAEAFERAVKHEATIRHLDNLDFHVLDYEFKSEKPLNTIDSLATLESLYPNTTIYIAQGQDNIMAILSREWASSDVLFTKYKMLMFPRGGVVGDLKLSMIEALTTPTEKQKSAPIDTEAATEIVKNIRIIGIEFTDDTSSSKVRQIIQASGECKKDELSPYIHQNVLDILLEEPASYTSPSCEVKPASGGRRKYKTRRFKRKSSNRKSRSPR